MSDTPAPINLGSLGSLGSFIQSLQSLAALKPALEAAKTSSPVPAPAPAESLSAGPLGETSVVWDNAISGESDIRCRLVSDGLGFLVCEKATSFAAMGEPKWETVPSGWPSGALRFLSRETKSKPAAETQVAAETSNQRPAQIMATVLRGIARHQLQGEDAVRTAVTTLQRLGLTEGDSFGRMSDGWYGVLSGEAASQQPSSPATTAIAEGMLPTSSSTPVTERLRSEWIGEEGAPWKVIFDPESAAVRLYSGVRVVFSWKVNAPMTESLFASFAEILKSLRIEPPTA